MKPYKSITLMIALVVAMVTGWVTPSSLYSQGVELLALNADNSVYRFDGRTGAFIGKFISGDRRGWSGGLAIGPDKDLYVTKIEQDFHPVPPVEISKVLRYDGTTGAFKGIFASGGVDRYGPLVFGPDGNLYVSSLGTDSVLRYNGTTGAFMGVFASGGGLDNPQGLVFGPDENLYVSNWGTDSVLRYNGTTGAFMDTFASGNGLDEPGSLIFGPDKNLYVTSVYLDAVNGVSVRRSNVLRFNGRTGDFMGVFASAGGSLNAAECLVFGPDGNLYVSTFAPDAILRFNGTTGEFIDIFVSGGAPLLTAPTWMLFTDGLPPNGPTLYAQKCAICHGPLASSTKRGTTISQIQNAINTNIGGMGSLMNLTTAQVQAIAGALAPQTPPGRGVELLVSSFESDSIQRYNGTTGEFMGTFASGSGLLNGPTGLAIGPDGNLYVSSFETDKVLRYNETTGDFEVFASGGELNGPQGLVFGPDDNLYVSSLGTDSVLRYNGSTGEFIDIFASGGGLDEPHGLAFGPDGNLYVCSAGTNSNSVLRYSGTDGRFMGTFAYGGVDLVFDAKGDLYVSGLTSHGVKRYDGTTGAFINTFVSVGVRDFPRGLAFSPYGHLFVAGDDGLGHNVSVYSGFNGAFIGTFVPDNPPTLSDPRYLIFAGGTPAPSNLRATAINAFAVDLEWADNAQPPNNEDYVQIWLSHNGTSFAYYEQTGGPDFTIFEDRAGDSHPYGENRYSFSGDSRFYRVRACGSLGCSAFSNVATPAAPSPPRPRTRLNWRSVVSADRSEIQIYWVNPTPDNADAIEIFRDSLYINTIPALGNTSYTDTGFSDSGLVPGQAYCYQVRALNYGGFSAFSNRVCATAPAPFAIRNLLASVAIDTATITFETNPAAAGRVEYGLATSCTPECVFDTTVNAGNGTRHLANIRGLAAGTEYVYRALATANGITVEERGRFATSPAGGASRRFQIGNLAVTPTLNSLTFSWTTGLQSTGQVEIGARCPGASDCVYTPPERANTTNVRGGSRHSVTVSGLMHSTEYCYTVTSSAVGELNVRLSDVSSGVISTLQGRPQLIARAVASNAVSPIDWVTGDFRFDPNFPNQMLIEVEVTNSGNAEALDAAITADTSIEWPCPQPTNQCFSLMITRMLTQALPERLGDLEPVGPSGRVVLVFPFVPEFIYTTGGVARIHAGVSYHHVDGCSTGSEVFPTDLTVLLPPGQVSPPGVSFDLIIIDRTTRMYRPFLNDLRVIRGEIEVYNTGPEDVHNVTVNVDLPETVALLGPNDRFGPSLPEDVYCRGTGPARGGQRGASSVSCSIPLLVSRGSRVIRFNGRTSIVANQDLGNMTVTVTPMAGDRDQTSNTAAVPIPRLSIP